MAKYEAIIFDWDGVLYDSIIGIAQNCVDVCKSYGVDIDIEYYKNHYTQPFWNFYSALGIPADTEAEREEISKRYWELHQNHHDTHEIFSDVERTLKGLKDKSIHIGIISAGLGETIEGILTKHDLKKYFKHEDIIARADHKVERILEFCQRNSFELHKVAMVGDLPSDIENGKEAGVHTIGIARFSSAIERLKKYNPEYVFENLDDILKIV